MATKETIKELTGDAFLAAAYISYLGAFTGSYREKILAEWAKKCEELNIPCGSGDFSLAKTLGDPVQIRDWQLQGLPTDVVSVDNGIVSTRGQRC